MPGFQPTIFVIDHDQDSRDMMVKRLQVQDYIVAEADTGERALAMLRSEKFEFVFLDANMSDVSSTDIVRRIKADVVTHETTIIVAGTGADEKQIEECMLNGADERLGKPYDIVAVKSLVWRHRSKGNRPVLASTTAASTTILVVDDDEVNLDLLSRRLKKAGYHVTCASGGAQSLRLLNSTHFDVVLLDIMMPELSGIDVLKVIRANPKTAQVSVIMVSALADTNNIQQCIQFGADDYMTKPFNANTLTSCIESNIQVKQQRDEVRCQRSLGHNNK